MKVAMLLKFLRTPTLSLTFEQYKQAVQFVNNIRAIVPNADMRLEATVFVSRTGGRMSSSMVV